MPSGQVDRPLRKERWRIMRRLFKMPGHGATDRDQLREGSLRRYSVGVVSRSKARRRVYLDTI